MKRFEKAKGKLFCTRRAELYHKEVTETLNRAVKALSKIESKDVLSFAEHAEFAKWQVEKQNEILCKAMYLDMDDLDYALRYEHAREEKDSKSG